MSKRIIILCLVAATHLSANAGLIYQDDFDGGELQALVWNNTNGGYDLSNHVLRLDTFREPGAKGFGRIGHTSGFSALTGRASFSVAAAGDSPLNGNFVVGLDTYANDKNSLLRINFAQKNSGPGKYEVFWNNSTESVGYETASGQVGELKSGTYLWFKDGSTDAAVIRPIRAEKIALGDSADSFGFWLSTTKAEKAVIDDFKIYDATGKESTPPIGEEQAPSTPAEPE